MKYKVDDRVIYRPETDLPREPIYKVGDQIKFEIVLSSQPRNITSGIITGVEAGKDWVMYRVELKYFDTFNGVYENEIIGFASICLICEDQVDFRHGFICEKCLQNIYQ